MVKKYFFFLSAADRFQPFFVASQTLCCWPRIYSSFYPTI